MDDIESLPRNVVGEWVRTRPVDAPLTKLVLQLIFERSGPQQDGTWAAWPSHGEIALDACLKCEDKKSYDNARRTVRKHIELLEQAGIVRREGRTRENGSSSSNLVVLLVDPSQIPTREERRPWLDREVSPNRGGQPDRPGRSEQTAAGGLFSPPQNPQEEAPSGSPTDERDRASAPDPADVVPEDFPAPLRPHARQVMVILKASAEENGSNRVTARRLALAMMANPHRRYVHEALQLRAWAAGKGRKDIVATYQNWLKRSDEIEGVERLDEHGMPAGAPMANGGGRFGRATNADRVDANVREALQQSVPMPWGDDVTDADASVTFGRT